MALYTNVVGKAADSDVPLVDALRASIITGHYPPGSRLVQEELAARFGTSRIPLREALGRLEGEGLVRSSRHRGAVVTELGPKDVADIYDLRLALETLAVELAAARYVDTRKSTRSRHALARECIAASDNDRLFLLDRDFHAEIAAAGENPHLVNALAGQWSQIMRIMYAYIKTLDYPESIWHEHESIAAAISLGDVESAVARLRTHLVTSRDHILTLLREGGTAA